MRDFTAVALAPVRRRTGGAADHLGGRESARKADQYTGEDKVNATTARDESPPAAGGGRAAPPRCGRQPHSAGPGGPRRGRADSRAVADQVPTHHADRPLHLIGRLRRSLPVRVRQRQYENEAADGVAAGCAAEDGSVRGRGLRGHHALCHGGCGGNGDPADALEGVSVLLHLQEARREEQRVRVRAGERGTGHRIVLVLRAGAEEVDEDGLHGATGRGQEELGLRSHRDLRAEEAVGHPDDLMGGGEVPGPAERGEGEADSKCGQGKRAQDLHRGEAPVGAVRPRPEPVLAAQDEAAAEVHLLPLRSLVHIRGGRARHRRRRAFRGRGV